MNTGEPCPPRASAGRRPSCVPHASPLPAAGPSDGAPGQVRSGAGADSGHFPRLHVVTRRPVLSLGPGRAIRLGLCCAANQHLWPVLTWPAFLAGGFASGCRSPLLARPRDAAVVRVKSRAVPGPVSGASVRQLGGGHHAAGRPPGSLSDGSLWAALGCSDQHGVRRACPRLGPLPGDGRPCMPRCFPGGTWLSLQSPPSSYPWESQCILEPPENRGAFLSAGAAAGGGRRGPRHSPFIWSVCGDGPGARRHFYRAGAPCVCACVLAWVSCLSETHPQAVLSVLSVMLSCPCPLVLCTEAPPRPPPPHAAQFSAVSGTVAAAAGPSAVRSWPLWEKGRERRSSKVERRQSGGTSPHVYNPSEETKRSRRCLDNPGPWRSHLEKLGPLEKSQNCAAVSGSEIMMCLCAKIFNCNNTPVSASLNGAFSSRPGPSVKPVTDKIQMVS